MPHATSGPYQLSGVSMQTWLLRYDEMGACLSPETRSLFLQKLKDGPSTDVIVFSHGWNNDFDAAIDLYREFLQRLEALTKQRPPHRPFHPIFLGISWPSEWLVFDKGPQIAAADGNPGLETAIATISAQLERRSADARDRFLALQRRASLDEAEAMELAQLLEPLLSGSTDDEIGQSESITAADLLQAAVDEAGGQSLQAPSADLEDYGSTDSVAAVGPRAAGLFSLLDPRSFVRLFSVYQMKDRAGRVGAVGIAPFLCHALSATAARLHAVGHSFGCKVMLSGICAPSSLPRPLASLLLLQPAISYLSFATRLPKTTAPGGYRQALDPTRVTPPILSTYSSKDVPLHDTFHLSLRRKADLGEARIAAASAGEPPSPFAALGGYGPRGAGEKLIDLPSSGSPLPLAGAPIIGLDGSANLINGHGDVRSPHTAWAMYQLLFGER